VSLPERFEAKISSLEDSRDLIMILLTELMNSLQTQKQRKMLREKPNTEGLFLAKSQSSYKAKQKGWKNKKKSDEDDNDEKEKYSACQHCKKNFSSTLEMLVETRCGV